MKRAGFIYLLVALSFAASGGTFLTNDSGDVAAGLRVAFDTPVILTGYGDTLNVVDSEGPATEFTFSGGLLEPWGSHWMTWEPAEALVVEVAWIRGESLGVWHLGIGNPEEPADEASAWYAAEAVRFLDDGTLYLVVDRPEVAAGVTWSFFRNLEHRDSYYDQFEATWSFGEEAFVLGGELQPPRYYMSTGGFIPNKVGVIDSALLSSRANVLLIHRCQALEAVNRATGDRWALEGLSEGYCGNYAFTSSELHLALLQGDRLDILNTGSGEYLLQFSLPALDGDDRYTNVAVSPDGSVAAALLRLAGRERALIVDAGSDETREIDLQVSSTWPNTPILLTNDLLVYMYTDLPSYRIGIYDLSTGARIARPSETRLSSILRPQDMVLLSQDRLAIAGEIQGDGGDSVFIHVCSLGEARIIWRAETPGDYVRGSLTASSAGDRAAVILETGEVVVWELP